MKPVNLVIVNPEGSGAWLSRIGRNSKDEEAVILFKMRGNERASERTCKMLKRSTARFGKPFVRVPCELI